jgi:imidazolonepropionase-like amidohydrolase
MAWTFEGVLLPAGVETRVVVGGAGEPRALPGRYAVAGLVDAHCHVTVAVDDRGPYVDGSIADRRLDELAAGGVALVRDVGGDREVTLPLARTPRAGRPEVVAAGRFLAPAGRYFPRMHEPVAADDLIAAVEREVADGATWVKLIADFPLLDGDDPRPGTNAPTYPEEVVAAAIAAAHRAGARVAAHANDPVVSTLIAAGVDSVEHGGALTEADLEKLAAAGGAWTPTLCAGIGAMRRGTDAARRRAAEQSERFRTLIPRAVELGVTVMTGSDVVGSVAEEIAMLVEHGLTPEQALNAAGAAPRAYLGRSGQDDLVTYTADPREHAEVLRSPAAVVLRGHRVR